MNSWRSLRRVALAACIMGCFAAVSPMAEATIARALELSRLVATSTSIVLAQPVSARSTWETLGPSRRIVTYTRVRVAESVVGEAQPGAELVIRTLGGRVGDIAQTVGGEASLREEDPALLFLTPERTSTSLWQLVGMSQGYYPVKLDPDGTPRVHVGSQHLQLLGPAHSAAEQIVGLELSQAIALIRSGRSAAR